ncbi:MAG: hydrogenase maturation nickel metallochaperone HypA [Candidatus Bathyarchaeia archaeon]
MHEFSFASSIVESVLDLATKQGASRVLEVHLRIGKLRALSIEQLRFSYGILAEGAILGGSQLIVEESNGSIRCGHCGYHGEFDPEGDSSFHFGIPPLICPRCGGGLSIEGGDECLITSVRMVLPTTVEGKQAAGNATN